MGRRQHARNLGVDGLLDGAAAGRPVAQGDKFIQLPNVMYSLRCAPCV